jgi:hypothetical protein
MKIGTEDIEIIWRDSEDLCRVAQKGEKC